MSDFGTYETDMESGEPTGENTVVECDGVAVETQLDKLEDVDHPFVPNVEQEYIFQEIGGITDLELLAYTIDDPDFYALLEGEAGTGKNMSINVLADAANWPVRRVNFSVGTTYSDLVGRYAPAGKEDTEEETINRTEVVRRTAQRLYENNDGVNFEKALELASNAVPDGSSFTWVDGLLTQAVKNGWIFVADEINAADASALMPLNGLTESRNERYLTIEERGEVIEPHPRFRFVATRNPVTYSGTTEQNSALESRGYIIQYDYHEDEALYEILRNRTDIVENEPEEAMRKLVDLVQGIRLQEQSGQEIMTKVATRDLIKIGRLTDIMGIRDAAETVLCGIADETDEQAIREMINSTTFR